MVELPVCEVWFDAQPAEPGILAITEPHTHALLRSNVWLVQGRDRDLLVDAGNGIGRLRPFVDGLRQDPAKPVLAIATHGHMDHAGGLWEFDERAGHPLDDSEIRRPVPLIRREDVWPEVAVAMADAGFPLTEVLVTARPSSGWDVDTFVPQGAPLTRPVDAGDAIDLGDRRFEIVHLPGHTPGSIGLWDASNGTLFCGDAVYAEDPLIDQAPTSSIPDYLETMRRLLELPVRIVHAGHDRSMDRATMAARCSAYIERRTE
jgi:glyoxylase-like metal-dependent hydrolase (beta-lactamase superfamily II)